MIFKSLKFVFLYSILLSCAHYSDALKDPAAQSHSSIKEISSMEGILPYIDAHTLVLFDLDNTVYEGAETYGHANWLDDKVERGKLTGVSVREVYKRYFSQWVTAQETNQVKPVEPYTPSLIKKLQKSGVKIMAITARQVLLKKSTFRQLRDIDVDFSLSGPSHTGFFKQYKTRALFENGVLFCGGVNEKGLVLLDYLKHIGIAPKKVILIDDGMNNLISVQKFLVKTGIDYTGLYYPLVEKSLKLWWDSEKADEVYRLRKK